MHYYSHHITDFRRGAEHLDFAHEGAYRRLLDWYFSNEKPLPADVEKVCAIAHAARKAEKRLFFRCWVSSSL